jgi:hypothetical protein
MTSDHDDGVSRRQDPGMHDLGRDRRSMDDRRRHAAIFASAKSRKNSRRRRDE